VSDEAQREEASRHRRSGIPPEVEKVAAHVPGRVGRDLAGTIRRARETRFFGLTAEVAFFFALGLPPLALTLLAIVGTLEPVIGAEPLQTIENELRSRISQNLDGDLEVNALGTLERLISGSPGLVLVPLIVAVYLAARGFTGAMRGLGHLYGMEIERPFWKDAAVTIAFTSGAAIIGVLATVGVVFSVLPSGAVITVIAESRWVVVPLLLVVYLTALYRYSRGGGSWRSELPGGLVGTAGVLAVAIAYAGYLRRMPELALGPFIGPVLGTTLATFSLTFGLAAVVLLGGAYNAHRQGGFQADPS
jgi:membrane protein